MVWLIISSCTIDIWKYHELPNNKLKRKPSQLQCILMFWLDYKNIRNGKNFFCPFTYLQLWLSMTVKQCTCYARESYYHSFYKHDDTPSFLFPLAHSPLLQEGMTASMKQNGQKNRHQTVDVSIENPNHPFTYCLKVHQVNAALLCLTYQYSLQQ